MATTASETSVQELYISYFGRPADPAGLAFYADALDAGTTTINDIATSFSASTEAQAIIALDTDAYLTAVYLQAFARAYDNSETADGLFWFNAIETGATTKELAMVEILRGAQNADETAVTNKVAVAQTFTTAVATDEKAFSGDTAAAAAKAVLDAVTSDAATVTSGNTAAQAAVTDFSFAETTFSLSADTATVTEGSTTVYTVTANQAVTEDTVVTFTLTPGDAAAANQGTSTTNLNDFAAGSFNIVTATIAAGATTATFDVVATNDALTELPETYTVTATVAGVTEALTATATLQDGVTETTFVLTTSVDAASAETGSLQVNGVIVTDGGTGTTAQAGDTVTGGAGTDDKVTIQISGTHTGNNTLTAFQTTGIEIFELSNFETSTANSTIVDGGLMTGLTTVGLSSSAATGDTSFTNLTNLVTASMKSGAGDLTVGYATSVVAGTADTQNLTVGNITGGTFTAAGVETVNLTTETAASTLTALTATSMTNLTVAGDQNLTITNALDFAGTGVLNGTLDASALTGNATLNLTTAEIINVTGGSGDDVFELAGTLAITDVIDGGAGTADKLSLEVAAATIDATAVTGELIGVSNVEIIQIQSTNDAAVLDLDGFSGVTSVEAVATTAHTVTTAAGNDNAFTFLLDGVTVSATDASTASTTTSATAIAAAINLLAGYSAPSAAAVVTISSTSGEAAIISGEAGGAPIVVGNAATLTDVTFNNLAGTEAIDIYNADAVAVNLKDASGATDALSVNIKTGTASAAAAQTVGTLTVADVETLTLDSSGLAVDITNTLTTLTGGTALTTLNVTGSSNLTLSGTSGNSKLATVNASALTADFAVDAVASLAQTLTSGSGNDTFTMAATLNNADAIDGGSNTVTTAGVAGEDTVSATITGLTATTGVINAVNIERFNFTNGGTAVIDASLITGTTEISVDASSDTTTLTNLSTTAAVGLGFLDLSGGTNTLGTLTVGLADETGTTDSLDIWGYEVTSATLKATAIETVNLKYSLTDTAIQNSALTVSSLNAASIVVDGADVDTGHALGLGTLDTDTTSVDASAYKGVLTAISGAAANVTYNLAGTNINTITGSTGVETVTVASTTAIHVIDAGAGTDTLNLTLGGAVDGATITNFEVINLIAVNGITGTLAMDGATQNINDNDATTVTITGGNSLASVTLGSGVQHAAGTNVPRD